MALGVNGVGVSKAVGSNWEGCLLRLGGVGSGRNTMSWGVADKGRLIDLAKLRQVSNYSIWLDRLVGWLIDR